MALVKCKECGAEVSTKAASCPNCGGPIKPKAKVGCLGAIGLIVVAFILAAVITESINPTKPPPVAAPEQEAQKKQEQARGARVVGAGVVLRESLRNPDSVVWESIRANDDASIICFEYRAQNGFGGMNRGSMAFINNTPSQSVQIWNKNCVQPLGGVANAEGMIKALSRN